MDSAETMGEVLQSGPKQPGFDFGDAKPLRSYEPDRDEVRAELIAVLEAAQAATDAVPWDARTFLYHKTVFPQMSRWLPDDERDRLCAAFTREVERIERLGAT